MGTIFKRYFLFFAVNIGIVITISLILNLLGVAPYIEARGINMESLAIYCLIWGMGAAFISLGISRIMAKLMMGVKVISPTTRDNELQWLVNKTHEFAKAAGLRKMPEVGIYESPELNAFATGPTKSRALVAVSTGLLHRMSRDEVEGVLAHEVSHIANGDMVTMTLIQGVMNAFVMFLARLIAFALTQNMKEESRPMARIFITIGLEIVLAIASAIVVAYFSRRREYRADHGGAILAGRDNMIAALRALKRNFEPIDQRGQALATLKISTGDTFAAILATHPPLADRIRKLEQYH